MAVPDRFFAGGGRRKKKQMEDIQMGFAELFLIGVGLSMDAFAAAICKGLAMPKMRWNRGVVVALFFGGFQALMPLLGWALGRQFEQYITSVDHWIAFLLLGWIGGKMIWDALHGGGEEMPAQDALDVKELFVLAVATSIDALAVGITFAFLQVDILPAVALIGCTTFAIALAGVWIGQRFGSRFKDRAALAGGMILCLIGLKILLEHLGMLG
jgi:putative Mn2+ efflux pump MntP